MRKIGLLFFGMFLSLFVAEGALRLLGHSHFKPLIIDIKFEPSGIGLADSLLGYVAKPGKFKTTLQSKLVSSATHWQDGTRATREKERDSLFLNKDRIHLYGCSFTYGQYLDDTSCLGWKLQLQLQDFDVRNYAFGGFGTLQPWLQLQQHLQDGIRPELVIIGYASFQDIRNVMPRTRLKELASYQNQQNTLKGIRWPSAQLKSDSTLIISHKPMKYDEWPLMRHSALINFLENIYNQFERNQEVEQLVSLLILEQLQTLSKEFNFNLLLVGMQDDLDTKRFLALCEAKGIRVLDVSLDLNGTTYSLRPIDGHPNAFANTEFARKIGEHIQEIK